MGRFTQFIAVLTLSLGVIAQVHASTVALDANGQWNEFNVDDFSSASQGVEWIDVTDSNTSEFGSALTYQFTIANGFTGLLSVVDASFAGDRFEIFNNNQSLGLTSDTANNSAYSNNFASNLTNVNFSSAFFTLGEGTYNISGALFSTLQPFNATNGAIKLEVTAVPLPSTFGLMLTSVGLLAFMRRRARAQGPRA
ncbi:MAG: VPLPA-CTERM sorting domain-containing protein [Pseudomonadota bacterium]